MDIKDLALFIDNHGAIASLFSGAIGAVIGGLMPLMSGLISEKLNQKRDKRGLKQQLYAEIQVILNLIEKREYIKHIKSQINKFKKKNQKITSSVDFPDNLFPIYKTNLNKLSLLESSLQTDIVMFYQELESLILDLKPSGLFSEGGTKKNYEDFLKIATGTLKLGKSILRKLKKDVGE